MTYTSKLKAVLLSPSAFFASTKVEVGYQEPIRFLLLTSIFSNILSLLVAVLLQKVTLMQALIALVIIVVIVVPIVFLGAAITHFFVKLFGGTGNYSQTFKLVAYSSASGYFRFIPVLGQALSGIWGIVLSFYGLKKLHDLTSARAVLVMLGPVIIIIIVLLVALPFFLLHGPGLPASV